MGSFRQLIDINEITYEKDATRVKKIGLSQALKLLNTKASDAFNEFKKSGKHIQRITHTAKKIDIGFLDASKLPQRKSKNTLNYYTEVMNNDPDWKKFPKRQIIGSYRTRYMDDRTNNVFVIFPFNNTNIGMVPSEDLWDGFDNLEGHTINNFTNYLESIFKNIIGITDADESLTKFKSTSKKFDDWYKKIKAEEGVNFNVDEWIEIIDDLANVESLIIGGVSFGFLLKKYYKGDFYNDVIKRVIRPKGFKTMKAKTYPNIGNWKEVWLDGPAVYVNSTIVDDLVKGNLEEATDKFKDFIVVNEYQEPHSKSFRGKTLDLDEAVKLIKSKAPKTWEKFKSGQSFISRITYSGRPDYSLIDSRKDKVRMSKNTLNYYTHIMNRDPAWGKFPKRQVIATSGYRDHFGLKNTYVIIPYDGTSIGVAKASDIWVSFDKLSNMGGTMGNSFNGFIQILLNHVGTSALPRVLKNYDDSLAEFKERAKEFDKWFNGGDNKDKKMARAMNREIILQANEYVDMSWFIDDIYSKSNNLYKAITEVYGPKGFKVVKSGSENIPSNKKQEVWFDGPAIMIDAEIAESMKQMDEGIKF